MMNRYSIQIGINGRFFQNNWRPAPEEITFAARNGFQAIQFPGKEAGLSEEHLGAPLASIANDLTDVNLAAVMEIVVRLTPSGKTSNGNRPLDVLKANLPAIKTLKCTCVHWHLVPTRPMVESVIHELEKSLTPQFVEAVAIAKESGFAFGFEHNEPYVPIFNHAERCQMMLDAVPGLHFVWDLNHTPPDELKAFQTMTSYLSMLHVSDTPLPEVNHHLPIGLGNIDFVGYFDHLVRAGFHGPAILEIGGLPKSGGYGRDTDEALIESLRRLQM